MAPLKGAAIGLVVLLGLLAVAQTRAQAGPPDVPRDTATVDLRQPPEGALVPYRAEPAFDYQQTVPEGPSWWTRLQRWLEDHVFGPLAEHTSSRVVDWLFYALAAAAVVYGIVRLLGMDVSGAFYRREKGRPGVVVGEEEMDRADFGAAIDAAEARGAFREAVRLRYLRLVRMLDDRGRLDARPEKTNRQYADELGGTPLSAPFRTLTTLFEHVWYGDVDLDAGRYASLRHRFDDFEQQIGA